MALERDPQRALGPIPLRVLAEPVVGAGGERRPWLHPEKAVEVVDEVDRGIDLGGHLLLGAEDVGVVLGDEPHAGEAVESARELVAVQRCGFGVADRQVAVAPQLAAEQQHVARAVHRLDPEDLIVVTGDQEHVLPELFPVARGLPERLVVEQRRLHLAVAALGVLGAADRLELVVDRHPLRVPERRARRVLVEMEQIELAPELAVVARAGLLEPLEMRVEVLLAEERRPVDARQLRVLLVAAPVGAGERGELEGLDRRRGLQVRAAAEVGEVALGVERDRALGSRRPARPCTARPRP